MRLRTVSLRRLEETSAVNVFGFFSSNVFTQYMVSQQKVWVHSSACRVSFYAGGQTGLQDDAFDFNTKKFL